MYKTFFAAPKLELAQEVDSQVAAAAKLLSASVENELQNRREALLEKGRPVPKTHTRPRPWDSLQV